MAFRETPGANDTAPSGPTASVEAKLETLRAWLGAHDHVVVAFSGGVDSSFLLALAKASAPRVVAAIGVSPSLAAAELADARAFANERGVEMREVETREMENAAYTRNAGDRCFHCKDELFDRIRRATSDLAGATIVDGTNASDLAGDRPGMRAALQHGVRSPLREVGLTKGEIRGAARALGLRVWDKPEAPCLASRFPVGMPVTRAGLAKVEAAEAVLKRAGFRQIRVRHEGSTARIETSPEEMPRMLAARASVLAEIRALGYDRVTLDLAGYHERGRESANGEG